MDSYFYDSTSLSGVVSLLKTKLGEYQSVLDSITKLKDTIDSSNDWVQENIKATYIAKYDEYIKYYKNVSDKIEAHIEYLERKNHAMEIVENAFSGGN